GMLEFARAKFPQHDFIQGDAEQLPIAGDSADVVVSNLMMQWINEPHQALEELVRIAAPAGQVVLSTVLAGSLSELQTCWAKLGVKPAVNAFATPTEWHSLLAKLESNHNVASVDFF